MRSARFGAVQLSVSHFFFSFRFWFICFVIHAESPGSPFGRSIESSIAMIAESINWAHKATGTVTIVLRNMAATPHSHKADFSRREGARNFACSKLSDLARIIAQVQDKTRVGICFDTCKCCCFQLQRNAFNFYIGSAFAAVCDQSQFC